MSSILSAAWTKASTEAYRYRLHLQRDPVLLDVSDLTETLSTAQNVLFVCYGNICRSPLAERYLRSTLSPPVAEDLSVDSAGLKTPEGRSSPETAVTVAAEFDIDLSDHRSKPLTPELIEWSDVLFIKDVINYMYLRRGFDGWEDKTYFLGTLTDAESYEISDPYGNGEEGFRILYGDVVEAVERLGELLNEREHD